MLMESKRDHRLLENPSRRFDLAGRRKRLGYPIHLSFFAVAWSIVVFTFAKASKAPPLGFFFDFRSLNLAAAFAVAFFFVEAMLFLVTTFAVGRPCNNRRS